MKTTRPAPGKLPRMAKQPSLPGLAKMAKQPRPPAAAKLPKAGATFSSGPMAGLRKR